jgi:hypothetical protein
MPGVSRRAPGQRIQILAFAFFLRPRRGAVHSLRNFF